MQNIEHIYLMYNVKQDRDALETVVRLEWRFRN